MSASGCGDGIVESSAEQLAGFEATAVTGPAVDMERILEAKIPTWPYRVIPGDTLQVEIAGIADSEASGGAVMVESQLRYNCRVNDDGKILLPVIGWIPIAGKSLAEIESSIVAQYYPKYTKGPPPVYVGVAEYSTRRVSIVGAVAKPGVYALRHDQMSLVALLMEAGGIVEKGAAVIRISQRGRDSSQPATVQGVALSQPRERAQIPETPSVVTATAQRADFRRADRPAPPFPLRAVFKREGPLNTTGWLVVENDHAIVARRWLDIGNEAQRRSLLAAVAAAAGETASHRLDAKLAQLTEYLGSCPLQRPTSVPTAGGGWEPVDATHVAASLGAPEISGHEPASTSPVQTHPAAVGPAKNGALVLPVRGLNIPFADVAIEEGDSVVVEGPSEQYVSVVGLVTRPGNMPYPPNAQYTLIQAIAFAGGLDLVADPRYVSVYRLKSDGTVSSAAFRLVNPKNNEQLTQALALPLRPGDIVSVEQTLRTRTNVFFDRFFQTTLGLGVYVNPLDNWGNND